jgi:hypothetical protein
MFGNYASNRMYKAYPAYQTAAAGSPALANTKSLSFGGTNEYLTAPDHASLDFSTAMTLSVWVKSAATADYQMLINKAKTITGTNFAYYIVGMPTTGVLQVIISGDGATLSGKYYDGSQVAFDGTWHHVAVTFGAGALNIYVDGVVDPAPTKNADNAVASIFNVAADLFIGSGDPAPLYPLTGQLDEISLWNAALTAPQIAAIYNSGDPTDLSLHAATANLVTWYRMGDLTDAIAAAGIIDRKGTNHATPQNMEAGDIVTDAP